jgi:hypothetical protein
VSIMSERYCTLLLSSRRTMYVSAAACSGSVQVLSVDPVSHFHTALQINNTKLCTYSVTCWRVHVTIVAVEKQQCLLCVAELHITVSCIKM